MNNAKKKRLEASGWKIGDVNEFLNLTPEETAYIEDQRKQKVRLKKHKAVIASIKSDRDKTNNDDPRKN